MSQGLQCLLLTRDNSLLELVRGTMQPLDIGLEIRTDTSSARQFAERRHVDGFVVDCDDVTDGRELVSDVRQGKCNRLAMVLAVSNGTGSSALLDLGANFVLGKPVTRDRLESHLSVALPLMVREHRRYFRFQCSLPLTIFENEQPRTAKLLNISEGGLALRSAEKLAGKLRIAFDLPSTSDQRVEVTGEVVWSDAEGLAGIRFLRMSDTNRQQMKQWLATLESQMMLRAGTTDSSW